MTHFATEHLNNNIDRVRICEVMASLLTSSSFCLSGWSEKMDVPGKVGRRNGDFKMDDHGRTF
jgi:hypothetical protein